MDISLFSKCLEESLLENDFVNISGLGCFLTELMPAYFSDKGKTINPPYKKLFFRETERFDNNLFLGYLKVHLSEEENPVEVLSKFVIEFKQELNKKKYIKIGKLGTMRATAQNDYFFVASEDLDIYPEGFGLEPISIKSHIYFSDEVDTEIVEQEISLPQEEVIEEATIELERQEQEIEADNTENSQEESIELDQAKEAIKEPLSISEEKQVQQENEKSVSQTVPTKEKKRRGLCWIIVGSVIVALVLFFLLVFAFKESSFSQVVLEWCENILYHLLYSEEELRLLGR